MTDTFDENRVGEDGRTYRECVDLQGRIDEACTEIAHEYDKHLLAVASGAFGLTLVFLKDIAPSPGFTLFLIVSWVAFGVAILTNLLAKLCSQWAMERAGEINKAQYQKPVGTYDSRNQYERIVVALNVACYVSLAVGFAAVLAFAVANQKGALMSKNVGDSKPPVAVPQQPPRNPHTDAPSPVRPVTPVPRPPADTPKK